MIDDVTDVFVAFETMNNRGKRLSDLGNQAEKSPDLF